MRKDRVSYHHCPKDMPLETWQKLLRRQFASEQNFGIENLGDHPVFSEFKVTNPLSGNAYKVKLRGNDDYFCECFDYKTNQLGTCKHIESVIWKLEEKGKTKKLLNKPYATPDTYLYLEYGEERRVRIKIGEGLEDAYGQLTEKYFDDDLVMLRHSYDDIEELFSEAYNTDSKFHVYPDVIEFIIERRESMSRNAKLDFLLDQGLQSDIFNHIIKADLFAYQKEGIEFAVRGGRSIIADDMGLGKTIQGIATAELFRQEFGISKVLIVCPTSLKYQWKTEIEKFTDSSAHVIEGDILKRRDQYRNDSFYKIISYNVVARDIEMINQLEPDLVILDEAQRIKNMKTVTATSVKKIDSTYAVVLTGTPLENRLEELYSIVQFVDVFKLGPYYRFLHDHQIKDEVGKVVGYRDLDKISENLKDLLIRRTKKKVLTQLPERMDKNLFVPMTEDQLTLYEDYDQMVKKLVVKWRRMGFLNEQDRQRLMIGLNSMRMCCDSTYILEQNLETRSDSKIEELMSILTEFFDSGEEKVVIFSQWERMTRLVSFELDELGIDYEYLHGGVPSNKRKALLDNFRDQPESKVFLSTDAGGVGLNLQSASLLINLDIPWNPAVLEQRIGRVHRMGQERKVSIINLVSAGTIEHRMLDLLQFKSSLAEGILDSGESTIFLGEDKFKKFMKSVEEMTEQPGEEASESLVAPLKEEDKDEVKGGEEKVAEKEETTEEFSIYEDDDVAVTEKAESGTQQEETKVENGVSDLLSTGVNFFGKLAETLSDERKTAELVESITEKDPTTGTVNLKIPVENEKVVENAVKMLGALFGGLKK